MDILDEKPYTVITDEAKIKAKYVIVASHFPVYDSLGFIFARMYESKAMLLG